MNNLNLILNKPTPPQINMQIANNLRSLRKRRKLSQINLSQQAGVSLGSLKRFERTGEISLLSLTKLAMALNVEKAIQDLFADIPPISIKELINERD